MQLQNRVAAITGGSAGIGRAIAEAYLAEGARVAIMARNAGKAQRALDEINAADRLIFVQGDATDQRDVEAFIDQTLAHFGSVDILVNNAGGAGGDLQPLMDLSDEEFDYTVKVNLYNTFWATRRALKSMTQKQWGRVINISSVEGKHGKPVLSPYTAAKHAINGLTKSVAREVGDLGVTVNSICPGLVITDEVRESGPKTAEAMGITYEDLIQLYTAESATKRPVELHEVASLAVLLASEAGASITGAQISIDGGTAQF
ncbi:MAG: SDR family oxidoreductase [Pseudomonadaceae bacterium]|nr:SDR family oxidoreductase [Pseudomonadaceae bacterium]